METKRTDSQIFLLLVSPETPKDFKRRINKEKFIKKTGVKAPHHLNQNRVMSTRFIVNNFDFKDLNEDNIKTT